MTAAIHHITDETRTPVSPGVLQAECEEKRDQIAKDLEYVNATGMSLNDAKAAKEALIRKCQAEIAEIEAAQFHNEAERQDLLDMDDGLAGEIQMYERILRRRAGR